MATVRSWLVALLVSIVAALVATAAAAPRKTIDIQLPADLVGTHNGIPYRIRVPANWNGTLLVHAHGTRLRTPAGPTVPDAAPRPFPVPTIPFEDQLLARGYALAGAEYANSIVDGTRATHALTEYFNGAVGRPSRVLVWGCSLGGMVSTRLIEKYPNVYDGAISCAAGSGTEEANDASLAFGLAYDVTFGWPSELWGPLQDVRDDLTFMGDVVPIFMNQLPLTPDKLAKWEFIRLVTKFSPNAYWKADPQMGIQGFAMALWRATEGRANSEVAFGGPVAQNVGHVYTLTDGDRTYLASLGMTNADELLAEMNALTTIQANHAARVHQQNWGIDGMVTRPLITMHSAYDGLNRTEGDGVFLAKVQQAGREDNLAQVFTALPGHCSFSTEQYLATLAAMESWLDSGTRPGAASFPASLGFFPGFVPPAWPF